MRLNPIGIIGGIVLIISPFLPWFSVLIFTVSLLDIVLLGDLVALLILILLVLGGIVSFFKGLIGGIIGLIGAIIFTILLFVGIGTITPELLGFLGIGYYLAWIGSIISIASIIYKPRAAPPPSAPPPPPP